MARVTRKGRVVRLGASLEPELLSRLDRWVRERNSPSRSDALRALIRKELTEEDLGNPDADAVATVTLLYRHDQAGVLRRLTAEQHRWGDHIRFTSHTHLKHGACLEVVALVGRRAEVIAAAEDLRGVRGILFGDYSVASPHVAGGASGHEHPHRIPRPGRPTGSRPSKDLSHPHR
jgi:CopG family nickel-responsive transcriptional regulator